MDQGEPVSRLLGPARAQTAEIVLPRQGTLDDPAACRVALFVWVGFHLDTARFDVDMILSLIRRLANIVVVIAFVATQVMRALGGRSTI